MQFAYLRLKETDLRLRTSGTPPRLVFLPPSRVARRRGCELASDEYFSKLFLFSFVSRFRKVLPVL